MTKLKSFGTLLDEYLSEYPGYETIVFFHDRDARPHLVVTQGEQSYDFTEIFTECIDLRQEAADKKKEVQSLQSKINGLQREKKSIENAIRKLAQYQQPPTTKGTEQ